MARYESTRRKNTKLKKKQRNPRLIVIRDCSKYKENYFQIVLL